MAPKPKKLALFDLLEEENIGLALVGRKDTLTRVNKTLCRWTGFKESDLVGKPLGYLVGPKEEKRAGRLLQEARCKSSQGRSFEFDLARKKGQAKSVMAVSVLLERKMKTGAAAVFFFDTSRRKNREERLETALRRKDVLLKEIHHRVKNNIQLISSLLRLQAGAIEDERLLEVFSDSQSRIRSISLIHEKLYQTKDLAGLNFGEYIRSLAGYLFHLTGTDAASVGLEVEVPGIRLETKRAIPCGLLINELVLNALKYAFPGGRQGRIRIEMRPQAGGRFVLVVSDNGIGLPEGVDLSRPAKLGFQIVGDLVRQLDGTMEVERKEGTTFRIAF